MWLGTVSISDFEAAGRWTVAFFSSETVMESSTHPLVAIGEVVNERKITIDPLSINSKSVNYLGLENVRSLTGELVDFHKRPPSEIKSRSKTYDFDDVLFGRLRPELNKVLLAPAEISPGICSNEFIILSGNAKRIHPRYLRYVLASPYVSAYAQKLRSGASLPRLSASDLLDLKIPLPTLSEQGEIVKKLERLDVQLRSLRKRLEWLPTAVVEGFTATVRCGQDALSPVEGHLAEFAE